MNTSFFLVNDSYKVKEKILNRMFRLQIFFDADEMFLRQAKCGYQGERNYKSGDEKAVL